MSTLVLATTVFPTASGSYTVPIISGAIGTVFAIIIIIIIIIILIIIILAIKKQRSKYYCYNYCNFYSAICKQVKEIKYLKSKFLSTYLCYYKPTVGLMQ